MQIFDLKAIESLGLPIEVVDGVPCIKVVMSFQQATQSSVTISVPANDPLQFRDVLPQLLGVCLIDRDGERVVITNVSTVGGVLLARGLYTMPIQAGQTVSISALKYVGLVRTNQTTVTVFIRSLTNE